MNALVCRFSFVSLLLAVALAACGGGLEGAAEAVVSSTEEVAPPEALGSDRAELSTSQACLSDVKLFVNGAQVAVRSGEALSTALGRQNLAGKRVKVTFKLGAACKDRTFSAVSYQTPGPRWDPNTAPQQRVYQQATRSFEPSPTTVHALEVQVPDCFYQFDFVRGAVIERFDPPAGVTYSAQNRLLVAAGGGTRACPKACKVGYLSAHRSISLNPAAGYVSRAALSAVLPEGATLRHLDLHTSALSAAQLADLDVLFVGDLNYGQPIAPADQSITAAEVALVRDAHHGGLDLVLAADNPAPDSIYADEAAELALPILNALQSSFLYVNDFFYGAEVHVAPVTPVYGPPVTYLQNAVLYTVGAGLNTPGWVVIRPGGYTGQESCMYQVPGRALFSAPYGGAVSCLLAHVPAQPKGHGFLVVDANAGVAVNSKLRDLVAAGCR